MKKNCFMMMAMIHGRGNHLFLTGRLHRKVTRFLFYPYL